MTHVLRFHVKTIDVIKPSIPRFGDYGQTPPVPSDVGRAVFNSPGNDSVTRDTDAMRVRNHDWSFQKPAFVYPCGACHFAVTIQAEIAGVNRVVERIVSTRNDCGNAGARWTLANFQFSFPTDQGRVTDLHTGDIRYRIQFPWRAIEGHTEIARANNFDLVELLYQRR